MNTHPLCLGGLVRQVYNSHRDKKKPKGFGVSAGTPGRVNAGNPNQLNTGKPKHYGISFSFKYLDQAHKKFCPNHVLHARWFRP